MATDLVIFLDINRFICMRSAIRRHGKKRSDLPDYLEEKMDSEFVDFLKWIWSFRKNDRKNILGLHEKYPDKEFLVFKCRRAVNKFLDNREI